MNWGDRIFTFVACTILFSAMLGIAGGALFGMWVLCGLPDYGLGNYAAFAFMAGMVTLTCVVAFALG